MDELDNKKMTRAEKIALIVLVVLLVATGVLIVSGFIVGPILFCGGVACE